jgi:hypothetical protein
MLRSTICRANPTLSDFGTGKRRLRNLPEPLAIMSKPASEALIETFLLSITWGALLNVA